MGDSHVALLLGECAIYYTHTQGNEMKLDSIGIKGTTMLSLFDNVTDSVFYVAWTVQLGLWWKTCYAVAFSVLRIMNFLIDAFGYSAKYTQIRQYC